MGDPGDARADLAYLTRPDRLVLQARQLGLVPARGGTLVQRQPAARLGAAAMGEGADAGGAAVRAVRSSSGPSRCRR